MSQVRKFHAFFHVVILLHIGTHVILSELYHTYVQVQVQGATPSKLEARRLTEFPGNSAAADQARTEVPLLGTDRL